MEDLGKKLIACIDLEKVGELVIDELALGSLKKVVEDSSNPFDDAGYNLVAPLLKAELHKALTALIVKLKG